jgi:hypothetical protein
MSTRKRKASDDAIPRLSNIQDKIENEQIDYFRHLLTNLIYNLEADRTVRNDGQRIHYYDLDEILEPLQEDIESIREKYQSKPRLYFGDKKRTEEFFFSGDDIRKIVLKHLNDYIIYFKKVADDEDRVDIDDIVVLTK